MRIFGGVTWLSQTKSSRLPTYIKYLEPFLRVIQVKFFCGVTQILVIL